MLSKSAPVMVTNPCRAAPAGTNGAISAVGTAASFVAGALVGVAWLVATICMAITAQMAQQQGAPDIVELLAQQVWLIPAAAVAGTVGSLLDSLLGATLQKSVLRVRTGVVVSAERALALQASGDENADDFKTLSGWDMLSNEGVNVVAASVTAVAGAGLLAAFA